MGGEGRVVEDVKGGVKVLFSKRCVDWV